MAPDLTERLEVHQGDRNKHQVTHPNLAPDTRYVYQVTANGERLGKGMFQTAKGPGDNHFSFIVFGDSGQGSSAQFAMASLMEKLDFSFALLPGDIIYDGGYESEFDLHCFVPYKNLINRLPFFPVVGNHDLVADRGKTFRENFFHLTGAHGSIRR